MEFRVRFKSDKGSEGIIKWAVQTTIIQIHTNFHYDTLLGQRIPALSPQYTVLVATWQALGCPRIVHQQFRQAWARCLAIFLRPAGFFCSLGMELDYHHAITYAVIMKMIIIDTNVFVAAMRSPGRAATSSRAVLRAVFMGRYTPLFGNALWLEYEDLLGRSDVWTGATTHAERTNMLRALAASGKWVTVYYGWRPNLPDEGDNHLFELAVAGNAEAIVTFNKKDLTQGQLLWPRLQILTPAECLEALP
jgi:predicted nucleic acid-binding protein